MSVTPEEIAAFADGQLDPARKAVVAAELAADPELAAQLRAHRALRDRLQAHFGPMLEAPVPDRLAAPLRENRGAVVDFSRARERHGRARTLPRWGWIAGPALAASLALAVLLPRQAGGDYAEGALAGVLDRQLVAGQPEQASTRILLSFRDRGGAYCRAFAGEAQSGIACREEGGWRLRMRADGATASGAEYRMAGAPVAEVLQRAQQLASGPALDATQEQAARKQGWR